MLVSLSLSLSTLHALFLVLRAAESFLHVHDVANKLKEQKEEEKKEEGKKEEEPKEEKKEEEKKDEEPPEIVLKVYMHCEGCAKKVEKSLRGYEGLLTS